MAITSSIVQVFTSSGTYTPSVGMSCCIVECVGAGGGSRGAVSPYISGPGRSGGYCKKIFISGDIGATETVTIGIGGTGGAAGNNDGAAGTATSFGAHLTANGAGISDSMFSNNRGATATGGDINIPGGDKIPNFDIKNAFTLTSIHMAGQSGSSFLGVSAIAKGFKSFNSVGADGFPSGSGGAASNAVTGVVAGANGSDGIVIITEFIS